jgi:hypothetical protein
MAKKYATKETCGSCAIVRTNPPKCTAKTPILDVVLSFDEALKLQAGIAEAIQRMNRCDLRKVDPELTVAVHLDTKTKRITVHNWPKLSN